MNVEQKEWENGLDGIAISLAQLGIKVHKRDVVKAILNALTDVAAWDIEKLESEFRRRDALKGHVCVFRCGTKEIIGRVKRIDPLRGLIVDEPTPMPGESAAGGRRQLFLPALTTSLVRITTAARGRAQAE
jgi:hypothetical protein